MTSSSASPLRAVVCESTDDFVRAVLAARKAGGREFLHLSSQDRMLVGFVCTETMEWIVFRRSTIAARRALSGMETREGREVLALCITHGHSPDKRRDCELCLAAEVLNA